MGISLRQQQWKQRYILEKITMRIWLPPETPTLMRSKRCSTSRRSWSWIRSTRFWMFPRLSGTVVLGWDLLCYITKYLSGQKLRYTSIRTQFFVWERCTDIRRPWWRGKINFNISKSPMGTGDYEESTEIQLSSSGIFCQNIQHCIFSRRFRWECQFVKQDLKNWRSDHLNVRSTTSRPRMAHSEKIKRLRKKISVGMWVFSRSWWGRKWYGTQNCKPQGQWNYAADVMVSKFEDSGHPVFRACSALDRGFFKKKGRDVRFTTVRILRMQSFYFALLILQISSVCTEQSRIDVMNWLSRYLVSHFQVWRNPSRKWTSSFFENWSLRKWIRWYEHVRRMLKQREIDCIIIKKDSKSYQER